MGGCKCSYRNCTVKSDGKTHLFHFPVFDKVRCNKWLKNAHRDDYLNLKVTQLKNRVICQHHFKDDQFMNFKKNKLKFYAVPTENGPFCEQEKSKNDGPSINISEISSYPITLEDIESDTYTVDKRDVPIGMKYFDFLTNGELSDLDCLNSALTLKEADDNILKNEIQPDKTIKNQNTPLKTKDTPTLVVQPYSELNQPNKQNVNPNIVENIPITFEPPDPIQLQKTPVQPSFTQKPKKPKVKIISEKKISEPLKLVGTFAPVSPNLVLPIRKQDEDNKMEVKPVTEYLNSEQNNNQATIFNDNPNCIINNVEVVPQETVSGMSVSKNRLSPKRNNGILKNKLILQRAAEIEKKRKFNMKLRDILNEGLVDTVVKQQQSVLQKTGCSTESQPKCSSNKVQATKLIEEQDDIKSQKDMFMLLQEQMRQMQEALVDRIENNSKAISVLQKTFVPNKKTFSVSTQTQMNDEMRKKELFREMSQYLSPDTKSAVYEELFINKYARKSYLIYSPVKRKKNR